MTVKGGDWLRRVRQFQAALLPGSLSSSPRADAECAFRPAKGDLSGDFYDFISADDADVVVVGDVTGKGLAAALVVAMLHGAFRATVHSTRHPCELLWRAHELLHDLGQRAGGPTIFSASVFVGVIADEGKLTWANAGHPSPFVLRRGRAAMGLDPTAPPIGLVAPESCEERTERLVAGDRLFLYTDGILPHGAVPDDLRAELDRLGGAGADDVVQHLIADGIDDDRTAVLVTYKGRD